MNDGICFNLIIWALLEDDMLDLTVVIFENSDITGNIRCFLPSYSSCQSCVCGAHYFKPNDNNQTVYLIFCL